MNWRFIDWIWQIRGSLALAPGQSGDDALNRLASLFHAAGTSHQRSGDTLTFRKKDQAAQDKMAVFDGGVLKIENGSAGLRLRYRLTSRILLLCFFLPLLFVGFGQLSIVVDELDKSSVAEKAKKEAKEKADKEKIAAVPQHPIDKFLGAPAPEKPKATEKDTMKKDEDEQSTPTAAYVLAGMFAFLYVVGRILEDRLVKSLFKKRLMGPSIA